MNVLCSKRKFVVLIISYLKITNYSYIIIKRAAYNLNLRYLGLVLFS